MQLSSLSQLSKYWEQSGLRFALSGSPVRTAGGLKHLLEPFAFAVIS